MNELGSPVKKAVSGPGPLGRGRGISSGPGVKKSSGPGVKNSENPNQILPPVSRGKPLATHTPDGRPIVFSGPTCVACNEMIIGQCLNALGKTYHPEHFVCTVCNKGFKNGQFVEHEGKPYCDDDYNAMFSPKCVFCNTAIVDKCINALNKKWHPQHFNCTGCGKNLVGKPYKEDDGELYCNECRDARMKRQAPPADICAKCKLPILGDFIIFQGQKVHTEHYRCQQCGGELKGGDTHEYEARLYCGECHKNLFKNICGSCNKPILGRSITALSRVWHPEHFVCYTCHEPFSGSNFFEHKVNGISMPFCELHYAQKYGNPCAKCGQACVKDAINFGDKVYHTEHFCCTACNKILKGSVQEWQSKPMCLDCYYLLPKDVRKQVEKKREAEKKLEKQREKEAKDKNKTK
jgi:hypothetical protein